MRKTASITTAASLAVIVGCLYMAPGVALAAESAAAATPVEQGKEVAFDRKKGNCLACHMIEGGDLPGNIGPPLVSMKARFPDKAKLREQISDSTVANPSSIMPPFGRHKILTDDEIDKIVEFVYTL